MTYDPFAPAVWSLAHGRTLTLGPRGLIMAIVNVTPDSFSDGARHEDMVQTVRFARACLDAGADILDIGGESTRPGAAPVTAGEEQDRILPVIAALVAETDAVLSVDTYRSETAHYAVCAGAHIINDVFGLQRDSRMADVAARHGAGLCIMHTGRDRQKQADVIEDQVLFLHDALDIARSAGVERGRIVLDPGFGFAKEVNENISLMARFQELHRFALPLLVGTSRKRFIGTVTEREVEDRDAGTSATTALLRAAGAALFRVHHVAMNRDALRIADAMLAAGRHAVCHRTGVQ